MGTRRLDVFSTREKKQGRLLRSTTYPQSELGSTHEIVCTPGSKANAVGGRDTSVATKSRKQQARFVRRRRQHTSEARINLNLWAYHNKKHQQRFARQRATPHCRYLYSPLVAAAAAINIANDNISREVSVTSRVRRSSFACARSRSIVLLLNSGATHVVHNEQEKGDGQHTYGQDTSTEAYKITHATKQRTAPVRRPSRHQRRPIFTDSLARKLFR